MEPTRLVSEIRRLLQVRRAQIGLTQRAVAERMDVPQSYFCEMENGARRSGDLKASTIQRWADALDARITVGIEPITREETPTP